MSDEQQSVAADSQSGGSASSGSAPAESTPASPPPAPRLTLRSGEAGDAVTDTVWSQVGGTETFERIARAFYRGVREDEVLAPMYPDDDWEGATWRIQAFLEQYWGGPSAYQQERGHPRLRMRHNAFPVTPDAKERWLKHMHAALDEVELPPMHDAAFRDYIERAALALVNRFE
ncbi:globin [Leucobacter albus]|uniref:Globin n=1 Tax=Leucobacter albus TaxID=272210 RepID=A0ABW3TJ30_9MICO